MVITSFTCRDIFIIKEDHPSCHHEYEIKSNSTNEEDNTRYKENFITSMDSLATVIDHHVVGIKMYGVGYYKIPNEINAVSKIIIVKSNN